jgi:glutamine---fructose-6-phosphate transaminase (isomerizing)
VCGIVGYVGKENRCLEVLLEGLKNLEYRGYDSAGVALQVADRLETIKQPGRLQRLT